MQVNKMATVEILVIVLHLLSLLRIRMRKRFRRRHRFWVRRIFQERNEYGHFNTLVKELELHDREYFYS